MKLPPRKKRRPDASPDSGRLTVMSSPLLSFGIILSDACGDQCIGPQPIVIIEIFVSQAEPINPLPSEIEHRMFDGILIAMIGKAVGVAFEDAKHAIDFRDECDSCIADDVSAVKIGGHEAVAEAGKFDP